MSRRDVSDGYISSAEDLAALVSEIIPALEHAGSRTYGSRWRERAQKALTRFRKEQRSARQGRLVFGEKEDDGS